MMEIAKNGVIQAAGCLQLCTGQEAGSEAAINAIHEIFDDNKAEAILLSLLKTHLIPLLEKNCFTKLNIYVQN